MGCGTSRSTGVCSHAAGTSKSYSCSSLLYSTKSLVAGSVMSFKSRRSIEKHTDLVTLLAMMPPDLHSSLSSTRDFDCDALAEYTTKPLSVMGYASITRVAKNLRDLDLKFLPKFLGTIGNASKRKSESSDNLRAHRLSALQFIHAQFYGNGDTDGLLREWATANPMAALALIIAALLYNNEQLVAYWRKKTSESGLRKNRSGRIECRSRVAIQNDYLLTFLAHTEFVMNMNACCRAELLGLVGEALSATNEDPGQKLEKRAVELHMAAIQNPEDPQCVIMVMESSLSVANIAHIFRQELNTHVGWCTSRTEVLQETTIAADTDGATQFSLYELDIGSERYNFAHASVLKSMIVPMVSLWVQAATRRADGSSHPLCVQALALASKYETMDPHLTALATECMAEAGSEAPPQSTQSQSQLGKRSELKSLTPSSIEPSELSDGTGFLSTSHDSSAVLRQEQVTDHPDVCRNGYANSFTGVIRIEFQTTKSKPVHEDDFMSVCKIYELI